MATSAYLWEINMLSEPVHQLLSSVFHGFHVMGRPY